MSQEVQLVVEHRNDSRIDTTPKRELDSLKLSNYDPSSLGEWRGPLLVLVTVVQSTFVGTRGREFSMKTRAIWMTVLAVAVVLFLGASAEAQFAAFTKWPVAGQNIFNTRSQALERTISSGNVSTLAPTWVFTTDADVSATPTVIGGVVYVPDWAGSLFAIDADKGLPI